MHYAVSENIPESCELLVCDVQVGSRGCATLNNGHGMFTDMRAVNN